MELRIAFKPLQTQKLLCKGPPRWYTRRVCYPPGGTADTFVPHRRTCFALFYPQRTHSGDIRCFLVPENGTWMPSRSRSLCGSALCDGPCCCGLTTGHIMCQGLVYCGCHSHGTCTKQAQAPQPMIRRQQPTGLGRSCLVRSVLGMTPVLNLCYDDRLEKTRLWRSGLSQVVTVIPLVETSTDLPTYRKLS